MKFKVEIDVSERTIHLRPSGLRLMFSPGDQLLQLVAIALVAQCHALHKPPIRYAEIDPQLRIAFRALRLRGRLGIRGLPGRIYRTWKSGRLRHDATDRAYMIWDTNLGVEVFPRTTETRARRSTLITWLRTMTRRSTRRTRPNGLDLSMPIEDGLVDIQDEHSLKVHDAQERYYSESTSFVDSLFQLDPGLAFERACFRITRPESIVDVRGIDQLLARRHSRRPSGRFEKNRAEIVLRKDDHDSPQLVRHVGGPMWIDFMAAHYLEDEYSAALISTLESGPRTVVLVGPSGSGKSATLRYAAYRRTMQGGRTFIFNMAHTTPADLLDACATLDGDIFLDEAELSRVSSDRSILRRLITSRTVPRILSFRATSTVEIADMLPELEQLVAEHRAHILSLDTSDVLSQNFRKRLDARYGSPSLAASAEGVDISIDVGLDLIGENRLALLLLYDALIKSGAIDPTRVSRELTQYWGEVASRLGIVPRILMNIIEVSVCLTLSLEGVERAFIESTTGCDESDLSGLVKTSHLRIDSGRVCFTSTALAQVCLLNKSLESSSHTDESRANKWSTEWFFEAKIVTGGLIITRWLERYYEWLRSQRLLRWDRLVRNVTLGVLVGRATLVGVALFLRRHSDEIRDWLTHEATPHLAASLHSHLKLMEVLTNNWDTSIRSSPILNREIWERRAIRCVLQPSDVRAFHVRVFDEGAIGGLVARVTTQEETEILRDLLQHAPREPR